MSRSERDVPKVVAAFGEKQFKETGASAVEVLRVKAVVMRKHFRQLKGIVFLVAVISLDRIRVYFFNAAGVMLSGENLDAAIYGPVRKSSKLIAKFEKPRVLTQEELRIEATQELRDNFGKAIRKVARYLAAKEPPFPDIFVTRNKNEATNQNFGLHITSDFEFIFEENILSQNWTEGLLIRAAFLLHVEKEHWSDEIASVIGNSLAYTLLREPIRSHWVQMWKKQSKGTSWATVVTHFEEHRETYGPEVFNWLLSVIRGSSSKNEPHSWIEVLSTIHNSVVVPIGTSEYHAIDGFCKTLGNPNQLVKRRHVLDSVHLAPRVFCDGASLGNQLAISIDNVEHGGSWASVRIVNESRSQILTIGTQDKESIDALEYHLNLEDIYPSTSGLLSHGLDIVHRALGKIGVVTDPAITFEARLEMKENRFLEAKEIAVLERLLLGNLDIVSNTLVGSPQIVNRLVEKECIIFIPDFNHLGIESDFVIHGSYNDVKRVSESTLESTIFKINTEAYSIVSAPTSWSKPLLESASDSNLDIWPIISCHSVRRLLRSEQLFVEGKDVLRWSEGPN